VGVQCATWWISKLHPENIDNRVWLITDPLNLMPDPLNPTLIRDVLALRAALKSDFQTLDAQHGQELDQLL
jgi:hypothetical protein